MIASLATCILYYTVTPDRRPSVCPSSLNSLYQKIDTEKLECLNESEEGSGKTVFKAWDDRLDKTKVII